MKKDINRFPSAMDRFLYQHKKEHFRKFSKFKSKVSVRYFISTQMALRMHQHWYDHEIFMEGKKSLSKYDWMFMRRYDEV